MECTLGQSCDDLIHSVIESEKCHLKTKGTLTPSRLAYSTMRTVVLGEHHMMSSQKAALLHDSDATQCCNLSLDTAND